MNTNKKSQAGIEYLIIIGFVTFAVTSSLAFSYFYVNQSQDKIKMDQLGDFSNKIINSAESVYYSGEPSKTTIDIYIPKGVKDIRMDDKHLIIEMSTSSGTIKRAFESNVPLDGTIDSSRGSRKITVEAKDDFVEINNT